MSKTIGKWVKYCFGDIILYDVVLRLSSGFLFWSHLCFFSKYLDLGFANILWVVVKYRSIFFKHFRFYIGPNSIHQLLLPVKDGIMQLHPRGNTFSPHKCTSIFQNYRVFRLSMNLLYLLHTKIHICQDCG